MELRDGIFMRCLTIQSMREKQSGSWTQLRNKASSGYEASLVIRQQSGSGRFNHTSGSQSSVLSALGRIVHFLCGL